MRFWDRSTRSRAPPISRVSKTRRSTDRPMSSDAHAVTSRVADVPLSPHFGWAWWLALLAAGGLVALLGYTLISVTIIGVGVWGVNIPYVWGFDLINYA